MTAKTAAIIIIGNEILSGKVRDTNSHYLSSELRALGVDVRRVAVIPDDIRIIAGEVLSASETYDYVFTSGGIGPTHDDMTISAIADAFGVGTVRDEGLLALIMSRCGSRTPDDTSLKMAEVPEGSELISTEHGRFPVVVIKNVYIFPGVPGFLKKKFAMIKDRFRSGVFYLRKIYLNEEECFVAGTLEEAAEKHPDVLIGSYPNVDSNDYKVLVTLESRSETSLAKAFDQLTETLRREIVIKTG